MTTETATRYELVLWATAIGWTNDGYGQEPCLADGPDALETDVRGLQALGEGFESTRFAARDTQTGEIVREWPALVHWHMTSEFATGSGPNEDERFATEAEADQAAESAALGWSDEFQARQRLNGTREVVNTLFPDAGPQGVYTVRACTDRHDAA